MDVRNYTDAGLILKIGGDSLSMYVCLPMFPSLTDEVGILTITKTKRAS
jgi:hypothetical protein